MRVEKIAQDFSDVGGFYLIIGSGRLSPLDGRYSSLDDLQERVVGQGILRVGNHRRLYVIGTRKNGFYLSVKGRDGYSTVGELVPRLIG